MLCFGCFGDVSIKDPDSGNFNTTDAVSLVSFDNDEDEDDDPAKQNNAPQAYKAFTYCCAYLKAFSTDKLFTSH